jgi:Protein of unknown function (DUF4232)
MDHLDPFRSHEKVRRIVRRRRRLRWMKIASVGLLALATVGAVAFGVDRAVAEAEHLFDKHHHQNASRSATSTTIKKVVPTTTSTVSGPPHCAGSQMEAYLYHWIESGPTLYEIVALTNASGSACNLSGYVSLSVSASGGGSVPAPVHHDPSLGASAGASGTPVSLAPGQQAWFEFSYIVDCSTVLSQGQPSSGAPGECYQGSTLGVIVPQSFVPLDVPQPLGFTYGTSGFDVGPFGSGTPPASPPVS